MAHDVAEMTLIPRVPRGREGVPVQIARLLHARQAAEVGTTAHDLLFSDVIRTNALHVWFRSEHLVEVSA